MTPDQTRQAVTHALKLGLSQSGASLEATAKDAGLSVSGVYKILRGECSPRLDTLYTLSDTLNFNLVQEIENWSILNT